MLSMHCFYNIELVIWDTEHSLLSTKVLFLLACRGDSGRDKMQSL